MKPGETPFYHTRVECPVCKTVNEFETIKVGAYTEEGRDSDFCPTKRQWFNPRYRDVNPLLYYMATCSSCFYTREFNRRFRDWKEDTAFRTYRQAPVRHKHLAALAGPDGVVRRLGAAVWPQSYPSRTAINKLLLGILDEQMLEQPSAFDIGRWYLRIAWLFRELGGAESGRSSPHVMSRRRLGSLLRELSGQIGPVRATIAQIVELVQSQPDCATTSPDDSDGRERSHALVADLETRTGELERSIADLTRDISQVSDPMVGGTTEPHADSYGEHSSYESFLSGLRMDWPGVPINEIEALRWSRDFHRQAYEEGRGIEPGNAQIQVAYLVGELARRVGEFDQAAQYFNVAVRTGREWMHQMHNDTTKTALARHIVDLATEQMRTMRTAAGVER